MPGALRALPPCQDSGRELGARSQEPGAGGQGLSPPGILNGSVWGLLQKQEIGGRRMCWYQVAQGVFSRAFTFPDLNILLIYLFIIILNIFY